LSLPGAVYGKKSGQKEGPEVGISRLYGEAVSDAGIEPAASAVEPRWLAGGSLESASRLIPGSLHKLEHQRG
jgi:hypothetical protein